MGAATKDVSHQFEQIELPQTDDLSKKDQQYFGDKTGQIGQVTVGS